MIHTHDVSLNSGLGCWAQIIAQRLFLLWLVGAQSWAQRMVCGSAGVDHRGEKSERCAVRRMEGGRRAQLHCRDKGDSG